MNFLQPWMLWALPAIGLPIAIHLIHKRRQKVVKWGAMMFLLQGATMSRGMRRLRNFLLLLLRTLAIAGLIIGLGRPIAGGWLGDMGGGRPDTVLVLLDRSASMREQVAAGGETKLEAGVARIAAALENVSAGQLACIDSVTMAVTELAAPGDLIGLPLAQATDGHSDIPGMLEVAAEHLRVNAAGRAEIWICTDGQATDWRPEDGRWSALEGALVGMPAGARVNVLSYAQRVPGNLGVRVTRVVQPKKVGRDDQAELLLDFMLSGGPASKEKEMVPVAIVLGGTRSVVQVELVGGKAKITGHRLPVASADEAGWGFVELPPDSNASDNRFYFTYGEAGDQVTVIVAEDPSVAAVMQFAAEAPPEELGHYTSRTMVPADASRLDLEGVALVIWQAPLPEGEAADSVERFLEAGGRVVFMPPSQVSETTFLGYGWGITREVGQEGTPAVPTTWRTEGDLLRDGEDGGRLPLKRLEISALTPVVGDVTRLAGLPDGSALLSRAPTSRGGLYFLGTSPAAEDSNLARQGVVMVALVRRALDAAAEAFGIRGQQDAGASDPLLGEYRRVSETPTDWLLSEHLEHAGIVQTGGGLVAINRPESEDEPLAMGDEQIQEMMPDVDVSLVAGGLSDSGLVEEIWRLFLTLILVAMVGEALLCISETSAPRVKRS